MDATEPEKLEALLAQCALGDQKAFSLLYKSVSGKLNGIAYRVLNDVELANEVLQEAFVQIWQKAGEYRSDKGEPMTWMASIVRYRSYDRIRFEKRRFGTAKTQFELDSYDSLTNEEQQQDLTDEFGQQLEDCLSSMETIHKESILMAYYYGYSREEISNHFQVPISTVKSWLRRGIVKLKKSIEKETHHVCSVTCYYK